MSRIISIHNSPKYIFLLVFLCINYALAQTKEEKSKFYKKAISAPLVFRQVSHLHAFGDGIGKELETYFEKEHKEAEGQKNHSLKFFNQKQKIKYHKVKKGESIYSISKLHGIAPKEILYENYELRRRPLYIGEEILIPSLTAKEKITYHKVKKGETLYGIAKKYNITLNELKKKNKLSKQSIALGQRLKIKIYSTLDDTNLNVYRMENTFDWPLRGKITSNFGLRKNPFSRSRISFHKGIDIAATSGTPFQASQKGIVIRSKRIQGYGNCIFLLHPSNYVSVYAHNKKNFVKKGQKVKQGDIIGLVGRTGSATGPHLHFEIRKRKKVINPLSIFRIKASKKKKSK